MSAVGFPAGHHSQEQFKTIIHADPLEDSFHVGSNRMNAQLQFSGDLFISHALKDQFDDSALSAREAEGPNDWMPFLDVQEGQFDLFVSGGFLFLTAHERPRKK